MGTSDSAFIEPAPASKALLTTKRQYRSPELKRKIVEESLVPGASVAQIARAHGVNANQVFTWRRKYRQELAPRVKGKMPKLLAVRVQGEAEDAPPGALTSPGPPGTIQIELPRGTVRIRGSADLEVLRTALEILAR